MEKIRLTYVIDDDPLVLFLAEKIIGSHPDYDQVRNFGDAPAALRALNEAVAENANIPDVILLDLNMNEMNGWEFIEEMQKIVGLHNVRVFVLTSSIDMADMNKSRTYNEIVDYVSKPLTIEKLDCVAELLNFK